MLFHPDLSGAITAKSHFQTGGDHYVLLIDRSIIVGQYTYHILHIRLKRL